MFWKYEWNRRDSDVLSICDRHYSRKNPGSDEALPPGLHVILLGHNEQGEVNAIWVTGHQQIRRDGYACWDNPYFRNESGEKASDLILQALACTRWLWQDRIPRNGLHTFVDPQFVEPYYMKPEDNASYPTDWEKTKKGRLRVYGHCYHLAGFKYAGMTKVKKLWRWVLPKEAYLRIKPLAPIGVDAYQMSFLEAA